MKQRFVSEALTPFGRSLQASAMAAGLPGLPEGFRWRGREYGIAEVLEQWRELSPCRNGSPERYLRKHWYRLRMADGSVMNVYFERQPRSPRLRKRRWWLFSVAGAPGP